ncbi:MAG TPA: DUF222 domain-containing protein [Microbacterium sp.]|uniref:HNH endonuclease signature motif containing protein n=1 Tax=Microbacterium sp. TaxID=51671 RepID=UPI002C242EF1|nr:DUF222 domain-containing protein [Microbacterium sp.]HWI30392.1 DUF222 domain-containing protein [Microbacterium sp.]
MDHFTVVDSLVGRLEELETDLARLAGERVLILSELAAFAGSAADELVSDDVLRKRERQALARRAVIADVAAATRTTEHVVTSLMAEAESLAGDFPQTLAALREGGLTHKQAQVIVGEAADMDADARAELERRLLLLARAGNHVTLKRQARRERERVLPESFAVRHARASSHRNVRIEHVRDGMSWISAYVPAGFAASIDDRLRMTALAHRYAGDDRTQDQLMADAFLAALLAPECACVLGESGEELPVPSPLETFRRIVPTVSLTVPALVLLGHRVGPDGQPLDPAELDGVGPIDPETARQLCGQASSFVRILTDPVTGAPITIDEHARVPSRRLKAWLRYRDGVCRHPGCSRPALRCDLDHTTAVVEDGATCAGNLAHLCRRHHRLKHLANWRYAHGAAGHMRFTAPSGRRYESPPERRVLRT